MLAERKRLAENLSDDTGLRQKRGHLEREIAVEGHEGGRYKVILRQSSHNSLDFSVILALDPPDSNILFRLRRYNGKSHEHTNHLEKQRFYDFHIHTATERYQDLGTREDAFAEPTDRYGDLHSAVRCLLTDCNFDQNDDPQSWLV